MPSELPDLHQRVLDRISEERWVDLATQLIKTGQPRSCARSTHMLDIGGLNWCQKYIDQENPLILGRRSGTGAPVLKESRGKKSSPGLAANGR